MSFSKRPLTLPYQLRKQIVCQSPLLNTKHSCGGVCRDITDEKRAFKGVPQIFSAALVKGRATLLELNNKPVCANVAGGKKCGTLFCFKMLFQFDWS
jgi:hypothetical protein